jgi:hypothetical protein
MLTKVVLVVALCGATVTTLAQDETRIFQYSPVARLVGEGQYRAEVWRRENSSGMEERAWGDSELHGSSAEAMAAACATLRKNYDDSFSCAQTWRDAEAGETVKAPRPPKENEPPANSPVPAAKAVAAPYDPGYKNWVKQLWAAAFNSGSTNWAKEFWVHQSRWSGGGDGGGGGGGGGGGCQ